MAESDLKNRYETPMNAGVGASGGGGAVGVPNLSGNDNAQKCWNFFVKTWGISKNWAAAFLGNIQQESQFNPLEVNPWGFTGICQWGTSDESGKRWEKLQGLYPDSYNTLEAQLAFIQWECENSSGYMEVGSTIKSQGDSYSVAQATQYIINRYEQCPGQEEEERQQYAANAYATFANT